MTPAQRLAEVAEVDHFLAEPKFLTDELPDWRESHISGRLTAQWPILDSNGVALEGTRLVFVCKADDLTIASISLLWRGHRIWGVDLVPETARKINGPGAARIGLPPTVTGSHFHTWPDNRDYALENGVGAGVPHRRPTPRLLTRVPHALTALAQDINLTLTPEQASFDVPPQTRLPIGKGGGA